MSQNFFVIYAEIILIFGIITIINLTKLSAKYNSHLWFAFMAIPILYFYFIVFSHTDNIPFKDDYSLLESIYQMKISSTFPDLVKAFLKQVNQHRFGFERSIMWLIYKILGNENIKVQIIIGNGFLIGILYLLIKIFKNINLSIAYFTPVPLLLFNLTYFENATWGIAAIQNTPIIFFALLTVHFLNSKNNSDYYLAIVFATITLFTSGNGISIWFVGILLLSLKKQWKKLSFWVLTMSILLAFYFIYDYQFILTDRANLLNHPFLNLQFLLAFWGNVFFQNIPHSNSGHRYLDIIVCILTGIFLLWIIMIILWKMLKSKFQNLTYNSLTLFGGMAFLACTGLMLVLSRPVEIRIIYGGEILSRRYMIFGSVFLCLGYLGYLYLKVNKKIQQKIALVCFILIGLFINISSYYTSLIDVYKQQQELRLDGYYWKNHLMLLSFGEKYGEKIGYNHPTYMINLINNLDSSGIYRLSQSEFLPLAMLIKNANSNNSKIFEGKIITESSFGNTIARENKERIIFKGINSGKQIIQYFALKSQKNVFIFPAVSKTNSFKDCFLLQSLKSSEFNYENWKAKFPSDKYEIWVIEKDNQHNYIPLYCRKEIQL